MTLREIAKDAGVSVATVSRVLNNHPSVSSKTRSLVSRAFEQREQAHEAKRAATIAYVYTGRMTLGTTFDSAVLSGVASAIDATDFGLLIMDPNRCRRFDESFPQMMARYGAAGAILRATYGTGEVCEKLAQTPFPSVIVGQQSDQAGVSSVYNASRSTSRDAVRYLVSLGHKRIGICINVFPSSDHLDRLDGYRDALADIGVDREERYEFHLPARRSSGAQLIQRVKSMSQPPTALYVTDPSVALAAIDAAAEAGLTIPDELSILGFDDAESRHNARPRMTAVCQDAFTLGCEAFKLLERLMADGDCPSMSRSLKTWVEVHESTGPAPASH